MHNRAVLILPYYGKWPWYFGYFLSSVVGKIFDVLLVTDLELTERPDNVRLLKLTQEEVVRLIEERLGRAVQMDGTYKLCDFKPMYGYIFEAYIKDYDYWIFGDCDVIFGRTINDFIDQCMTEGYDIVALRKHWISGPFCMMRNTPRVNLLYREARDLDDVFVTGKTVCFDELGGFWFNELMAGTMTMDDCRKRKEYFAALVWRTKDLKFFHDDILCEDDLLSHEGCLKAGRLWVNDVEWPIFHFINAKRCFAFRRTESDIEMADFHISKLGFISSERIWQWRKWIYAKRRGIEFFRSGWRTLREKGMGAVLDRLRRGF